MVKPPKTSYVSNRVLKLNVGFLLNDGPAHSHETTFDAPAVRITDDLTVRHIRGTLRLSRTKEGILVQGKLHVGLEGECYRCLDPVLTDAAIHIEELYATTPGKAEFRIFEDGILDLAPLLRDEVLIILSRGLLCSDTCRGLCPECGANLNHTTCSCRDNDIDPRFARLKELLDRN